MKEEKQMATAYEKAQVAMELLQEAILETVQKEPGITNAKIARDLGIKTTDRKGTNNDRISWATLELLIESSKIRQEKGKGYFPL